MRYQRLAVLAAAVLFIGPVLADRQKAHAPCETTPPPVVVAPAPADRPCPGGVTLPSPSYLQHPPQYLTDEESVRQAREEFHRFWMNNQPSTMTYERLHGAIGP
jgi:hypothetical protein